MQGDQTRISSDKYERHILNLKEQHEAEVAELRSKITFLINKIENEDERSSKPSLGNVSFIGAELVQSKMHQSNSCVVENSLRRTLNFLVLNLFR